MTDVIPGNINSLEREKFVKDHMGNTAVRVNSDEFQLILSNKMKFWEMKGLTLEDVENAFGFDFVVVGDCIPVINNEKFVIVER